MANPRIASDLIALLPAVQTQIVAAGVVARPELCILSLGDADVWENYPVDNLFVVVGGGRWNADQAAFAGGGNLTLIFDGALAVNLWARVEVDLINQDQKYLTDPTLGVLNTWSKLVEALSNFEITDASGNQLLEMPLRILSFEIPKRPKGMGWGRIASLWGVAWQQANAQSVNA